MIVLVVYSFFVENEVRCFLYLAGFDFGVFFNFDDLDQIFFLNNIKQTNEKITILHVSIISIKIVFSGQQS